MFKKSITPNRFTIDILALYFFEPKILLVRYDLQSIGFKPTFKPMIDNK